MIASVQSAIVLLAALWTGFSDEDSHGLAVVPSMLDSLGVFLQGLFIWAVVAELANLVSNGARSLEIQVAEMVLTISEEEGGETES